MPTLKLEIDTTDRALVDDLLEGRYDADPQRVVAVPGNAELRIDHLVKRFAVEVPETIVVLLDIGKDVAIGLLSAWLYDKLKGRAQTLTIEDTEVHIVQSDIEIHIKRRLEKPMSPWHSKAVGDGVQAFQPAMQLHQAFLALVQAGGVPANAAVFSYYDLHANVVTWYFTPEATTLAKAFGAIECEKPVPQEGFGLLSGDGRAWETHFPGYVASRRRR